MVSIVIEISDGRTLEVGVVTKKGFAGGSSAVGQRTSPYRMICQPPVDGFRIKAEVLQQILPVPMALENVYCITFPTNSGPDTAAVVSSGY